MPAREHELCLNCGAREVGAFCAACGQKNSDPRAPIGELAVEVLEESLGFDSRLRHTLPPFLLHPGVLTREYNAGRRARYTSPLKLYLVASILFFLAAGHARPTVVQIEAKDDPDLQQLKAELAKQPQTARTRFGEAVRAKAEALKKRDPQHADELQRSLSSSFFDMLPKAMFVLLPLFALLLKLLWWRSGKFYAEQVVFALHEHAFAMLLLAVAALLPGEWPILAVLAAIAVHLYLALRTVFAQSRWLTALKCLVLAFLYSIVLTAVVAGLGLAALWFA